MKCWILAIKNFLKTGKWQHAHDYNEYYKDSYYNFKKGRIIYRYSRYCSYCGKKDHLYY